MSPRVICVVALLFVAAAAVQGATPAKKLSECGVLNTFKGWQQDLESSAFCNGAAQCPTVEGDIKYLNLDCEPQSGPTAEIVGVRLTYGPFASRYAPRDPFYGTLPANLTTLTGLATLYLNNNNFSGDLPIAWSGFTKLKELFLDANALGGTLPAAWSALVTLTDLRLNNQTTPGGFEGTLPKQWSTLTNLKNLQLGNNTKLTGFIPNEWSTLTKLGSAELSKNGLNVSGTGVCLDSGYVFPENTFSMGAETMPTCGPGAKAASATPAAPKAPVEGDASPAPKPAPSNGAAALPQFALAAVVSLAALMLALAL